MGRRQIYILPTGFGLLFGALILLARRDLLAFYSRTTASDGRFQFYVSRGLSDGSPDWGAGLAISTGFK